MELKQVEISNGFLHEEEERSCIPYCVQQQILATPRTAKAEINPTVMYNMPPSLDFSLQTTNPLWLVSWKSTSNFQNVSAISHGAPYYSETAIEK